MKYIRPMYSVVIVTPKGTKYTVKKMSADKSAVSNLVIDLTLSEARGQLAQKATIKMFNQYIDGKGYPSSLFPVKSRVFIYAKGGGKEHAAEVFRGYVWETDYNVDQGTEVTLTCYDNLIYFMKSEILQYFSKGKKTRDIVSTLMEKRGVKLSYQYLSITHPKLPLSGTLADVLTGDLLDEVQKKKGTKYTIRSEKGKVYIDKQGSNQSIYRITRGEQGIMLSFGRSISMDEMVTNVVITGKTDENGKAKVEAKVKRNCGTYGTLTKLLHKDEDTKLSEIKEEARYMLDENSRPQKEYTLEAMDIPWIHKGDRISIEFRKGTFSACIVSEITHNCSRDTMQLTVEPVKK